MSYRGTWEIKKGLFESEEDKISNTPVDEYFFWKNLIEGKQNVSEDVPAKMFELLDMAETKMIHFLMDNHHTYDLVVQAGKQKILVH